MILPRKVISSLEAFRIWLKETAAGCCSAGDGAALSGMLEMPSRGSLQTPLLQMSQQLPRRQPYQVPKAPGTAPKALVSDTYKTETCIWP